MTLKASSFQAIKQGLFAKGLTQESDCPSGEHLRTRNFIGLRRNEDRWRRKTVDAETGY